MVPGQQLEDGLLLGRVQLEALVGGPADEPFEQLVGVSVAPAGVGQPVEEQAHARSAAGREANPNRSASSS